MEQVLIGDSRRKTVKIKNLAGALTDPSGLTFKYSIAGGTAVTLTYGTDVALVKESTGIYHVDFANNTAGVTKLYIHSTGTVQAAIEDEWYVQAAPV